MDPYLNFSYLKVLRENNAKNEEKGKKYRRAASFPENKDKEKLNKS